MYLCHKNTPIMKKSLFIVLVALLLVGCNQQKERKTLPETNTTAVASDTTRPDTPDTVPAAATAATADPSVSADPSAVTVERDTTAPLGTPANPLKIEPGKPLDFSKLFQNNSSPRSFAENVTAHIDTVASLAQSGDINAMYLYGSCYEQGWGVTKDYGKAMEWYKKAADKGQKSAMGAIGGLYRVGHGVQADPKQAFEWFKKGAEREDDNSMLCLGNCYYTGFGTNKDLEKAAYWWEKAAEGGNGFALSQIGDAYYGGLGVEPDLDKAVKYYQQAVAKNVSNAQYRLGVLQFYGQGVPQDTASAHELIIKARDNGVEPAQTFLDNHFK